MPNDETATRPTTAAPTGAAPTDAATDRPTRSATPDAAGAAAAEPADLEAEQAAALSRAAREAVRQPADPRIDRQLARMGLAPDTEPAAAPPASRVARAEDLDALERRIAELAGATQDMEQAAVRARRRVDQLAWVVTAEGVAIVILTALLLLR